jgi:hypothetical protein
MTTDPFDAPGKRVVPGSSHTTSAPAQLQTRPSALRFEHKRHMYFDGKKWLPSVTGIIKRGGEDQSGLFYYYAGQAATCAIEEAAEVSRIRRLEGDDAAHEFIKTAADRHRDRATVAGSDLHDVADRMLSGAELPEHLHDNVKKMAENVLAFMSDYRVDVLHSEARLAHRTLGYCGTTDQIGIVPQYGTDLPLNIDWKTSESMYRNPKYSHGKNAMQLAPYSRAEVMFWDDKTEVDMVPVSQEVGLIVMIRPEGYKVYEYDLVRGWEQFQRALKSYHWWRDVDEMYRGPIRPVAPAAEVAPVEERASGVVVAQAVADLGEAAPTAHNVVEIGPGGGGAAVARHYLLDQIDEVLDPATFDDLWEAHQDIWTDEHTAAVKARIAELGIAS